MSIKHLFTDHPKAVGETYTEHAMHAARFGFAMWFGGLAGFAHAVFPWICTTTGSRTVVRLHDRMVVNRSKNRLDEMRSLDPLDCLAEHI